jgi:cysteine desulfurase/selenocysteine lyase
VKIAHARGIPVLVDGSQAAVHQTIDVQDIDCDFYIFTGHKLYGPTGIGVLHAKYEHLVAMRPYNGGGEMIRRSRRIGSPMAIRRTNRGGHARDR